MGLHMGLIFFGFVYIDNFYMATPEKAILDTLYYRKKLPASDELELEGIDVESLNRMVKKFPYSVSRHLPVLFA